MSNEIPLPVIKFPETGEVLVTRALDVITQSSAGRITDVSVHSPLTCLVEGLVWTQKEFVDVLNQLPYAMLLAMLNTYGYQLALGSASVGTVTVTLTTPIGSDLSIAAGWRLNSAGMTFITTEVLMISAGNVTANVAVVSEGLGAGFNVSPGAINGVAPLATNSPFIASISNLTGTSGGTDAESVTEAIIRASKLLHSRDAIITITDYQNATNTLAGSGSRSLAIPSLSKDKVSKEVGCVHVFVLNSNLLPASTAQLIDIERELALSIVAGTTVYTSEVELFEVSVKVICNILDGVNPDDAFEEIVRAIKGYINPYVWDTSRSSILVKELEYLARDNVFVSNIQGVYIKQSDGSIFSSLNIPLPHAYSLPRMTHITVNMVSSLGEFSYGYGYDPRDTPETLTQSP